MPMTSDPCFLDSNVLIYSIADSDLQKRAIASEILKKGLAGSLNLYLSPQILLEFYSITTNTKKMHIPLAEADAKKLIEIIISSRIKLIYPGERALIKLLELMGKKKPTGAGIFDFYIMATMMEYGIKRIYTENITDFHGLKEIEPINPFPKH